MSHSERDESVAAQAQFMQVALLIESLLRDGLSFDEVAELLQRGVAAAKYRREHEGEDRT